MFTRKSVVLAKIELSYGTDLVPTASANALLVKDLDIKPVSDKIVRDVLRTSLSPLPFARGTKYFEISFKTELKGLGVWPTTTGEIWCLLRACGLYEVYTVGPPKKLDFGVVSQNFESVTLYGYKDGIFHKFTGCVGDVKLSLEVGKIGEWQWKFWGMYHSPVDLDPGALTFSSAAPIVCLNGQITVDGYGPVLEKIEIALNNKLALRKDLNSANGIIGMRITGREPGGSFDPEAVLEATHDFWARWEAAQAFGLNIGPLLPQGGADGSVQVTGLGMQYEDLSYGDRNGILTYQVPFRLASTAGDDEVTFRFT